MPRTTTRNGTPLTLQPAPKQRLSRKELRDVALADSYIQTADRIRAQWKFWWTDHAWIRAFWDNQEEIAPGVWRSNQPSPARIARLADMGICRVLSLRGFTNSVHHTIEANTCRHFGIHMEALHLSATQLARPQIYLALLDRFESYERPFLMHCKSGADRAGLASAFYLLHVENAPIERAKEQLGLKFAHVRRFRTGILDYLLDRYEQDAADNPVSIRDWLATRYDRDQITADYLERRKRGVY